MDAGRVIAEGPPRTVMESAAVIDAYLGKGAPRGAPEAVPGGLP
jgi:hypothetical protein